MSILIRTNRVAFLMLVAVISGCSGDAMHVPVSGIVTLDGKPLADAKIVFEPIAIAEKDIAAGSPSYGRADESGRYSCTIPLPRKMARL